MLAALLALWACTTTHDTVDTSPQTHETDPVVDTDVNDDVDWDGLYGEVPDEVLPAPEFAATNRDGSPRSREHLLGHPTVLWFYPAASTGG